jgi:hypothetical protein
MTQERAVLAGFSANDCRARLQQNGHSGDRTCCARCAVIVSPPEA